MISSDFLPSTIEINSLGIGLLNYSNIDKLDLSNEEYLVVGEQYNVGDTTLDTKYNLIINRDGIAVNTTRRQVNAVFSGAVKNSGLYVDDNIMCSGNIIANGLEFGNIKLNGYNSNVLEDILKSVNEIDPLLYKGYGYIKFVEENQSIPVDNIYTPSFITIGGVSDTFNNANPLNIATTANYNVDNVHMCIQNKITNADDEPAKLRIGMIGNAADSPAVITTTRDMPIHFHVSKSSTSLNNIYSDQTGYPNFNVYSNSIPSLCLDKNGCVVIGDTESSIINYSKYNKINDVRTDTSNIIEYAKIKIKGSAQIDNIITYDYFTKSNLHIDDIYVRKLGRNFQANQIIPGDFVEGLFVFNSNLYVGKEGNDYTLEVNNKLDVKGNLNVYNQTFMNKAEINTAVFNYDTIFDNDIHINKDVILGGDIKVNEGDLFIANTRINISTLHPIMIDLEIANASNINGSNILLYATGDVMSFSGGSNFVVPGRLGVGVLSSNEYNEQLNVIKRNPRQFELLLQDSSEEDIKTQIPMVYMGHLQGFDDVNYVQDRSFIVNTNKLNELHNIYFYPGVDLVRRDIKADIPTLTIHQNNRVGINTANPKYSLDINGDMLCKDIYINRNNQINKTLYFISKSNEYSAYGDLSRDFYYLYDERGVNKFCINFIQNDGVVLKGLNVKNGIHAVDDGYYENNIALATLKMIDDKKTMAYTKQHITIGWKNGDSNIGMKPLNIRNLSELDYNDSIIRLYRGKRMGGARNSAIYSGIDICEYETIPGVNDRNLHKWFMYKNHLFESDETKVGPLQFGYTNNTQHPTHYGMSMYYNKQNSNYYIDINNPIINNNLTNRKSALAVYGDLEVHGNVNIIGSNYYKINGISVSPNAIQQLFPNTSGPQTIEDTNGTSGTSDTINDVVITGKKIAIMPQKTLAVGQVDNGFVNYLSTIDTNSYNTPLTVYQKDNDSIVSRFLSAENPSLNKNTATIELGVFNTVDNFYHGIKKNTALFKVSNYSPPSSSTTQKSVLDICMHNNITNYDDKVMSIYHDSFSSYINIGNVNTLHDQATGVLNIGEIQNVGLHVENPSKYLLQLTNHARAPAINMHKSDSETDKFWIMEAHNDDGNFAIKHSEATQSYIPDENKMKNIVVFTNDGKLGINIDKPEYNIDVKSKYNSSSINVVNKYNDIGLSDDYSAIQVTNSNLEYNLIQKYTSNIEYNSNLYEYNTNSKRYYSGLNYSMSNIYYPQKNIKNEDVYYDFIINSNFVKNNTISLNNVFEIATTHDIEITSNNTYINPIFGNYLSSSNKIDNNFNVTLNSTISLIPNILPEYSNVSIRIKESDIMQKNVEYNVSISFKESSTQYLNTIFNYSYNHTYTYLCSNNNYRHSIIQNGFNNLSTGVQGEELLKNLYTSNVILTYLDAVENANNNNVYDSVYSIVKVNLFNTSIISHTYNNYVITSNVFFYNKNDAYQLNVVADIKKYYEYYSEVSGPSTIINPNASNIYSYQVNGNNQSKTFNIDSKTNFLNTVPYGAYDGFDFGSNIVMTQLKSHQFNDSLNIFNNTFNYIININDMYGVYDFITDKNIRDFYMITRTLDYQPHLILRNNIEFIDNNEKQLGKINKIYSKNGTFQIASEDESNKTVLLDINDKGDIKFDGKIYANELVINGNIYDRLGNSMLINYSEEMYAKAFYMQTSNYILQTSNYAIHSSSNIQFVLEGKERTGVVIMKPDIYNEDSSLNDFDLFRIYEANNTTFNIKNGGKIGIKFDKPRYELDINGDMYASNIYSEYVYGNGITLHNVNLADRNTGMLKEGSNLYYTPERVGVITFASNLETSNYIRLSSNELGNTINRTSNIISNRITLIDTGLSNYIRKNSNDLENNIIRTSNVISERITYINNNMSNYVGEVSNRVVNNLNTNLVPEGTNNKYYTETYFDNSLTSRTLDFLHQGTSNLFIKNKQIDIKENDTLTITGNVYITGSLTTVGESTTITPQQVLNTSVYISGYTNDQSFKINRPDTITTIMSVSNYSGTTFNNDIFYITAEGNVGIGIFPTSYRLHVNGNMYATNIYGNGANITNVNLNDRTTDALAEGTINKYYNPVSVGNITRTSNIFSSNYISNTSNELGATIVRTSNIISDRITLIDSGLSNYVNNVSNMTNNFIITTDNNMSNYLQNTIQQISSITLSVANKDNSNYTSNVYVILDKNIKDSYISTNESIGIFNTNMSTYIKNTSNELGLTIVRCSNIISDHITNIVDVGLSNYIRNTSNDLGLTILRTSNIISDRITNIIDVGLSNYISNTSNDLELTILRTSNIISDRITNIDVAKQNVLTAGTNISIVGNVISLSGSTSQWTSGNGLIYYNSGSNVGIGTTNPSYKLDVVGQTRISSTVNLMAGNPFGGGTANQILFGYQGSESYRHAIKSRHQNSTTNNQNAIDFYLWKNGQLSTDVGNTLGMSITAGGIGIGNTAPAYQLDVINDINYTGILRKSGTDILATKQNIITGGASTITTSDLTFNRALVSDGSGKVAISTVSDTELGYLSGTLSSIQTQLNSSNTYITNTSNVISNRITNLTADQIANGTNKKFIINGIFNEDLTINGTLITSNLNVVGTTTLTNTTSYQTENLEIISQTIDAPALKVIQNGTQNIVEFIDATNTVFVIKDGGNIGIGTTNPQSILDVVGNIKISGNINNTTSTELGYLSGVSSSIQTQLNGKESSISLGATQYALINTIGGKVGVSTIPLATLNYLSGTTSAIQTQLNGKESTIALGATQYALINTTGGKVGVSTIPLTTLNYLDATSSIQTQLNGKESSISLGATQYALINTTGGKVGVSTIPLTTLNYLDATSSIQTQLNGKESTIALGATQYALINTTGGKVGVSTIPLTTLNYLSGATSSIQTQLNAKQATITGGASTITTTNLTLNRALISDGSGKVAISAVTNTELGYLSGALSSVQTQLNSSNTYITNTSNAISNRITTLDNAKQTTITGGASTITTSDLTINRALVSDASGKVAISAVTNTELGYLSGTLSSVQTQLNSSNTYITNTSNVISNRITTLDNSKQNTITGGASTITTTNLTLNRALVSDASGKVAISAVTNTELGYLSGALSSVQTQLNSSNTYITNTSNAISNRITTLDNAKQTTITGGASTITTTNLTLNRALISDSSGKVAVSTVTNTELGYLTGATSSIQTQLNAKQATLTAGTNITITGTTIGISGTIGLTNGGIGITTIAANSLIGATTANTISTLSLGTGLSITGSTLNVSSLSNNYIDLNFINSYTSTMKESFDNTIVKYNNNYNITNNSNYLIKNILNFNNNYILQQSDYIYNISNNNIVKLVCSQYHTVYLENTGKVLACGYNIYTNSTYGGITGTRSTTGTVYVPEYVLRTDIYTQMTGIVSIVCSNYHAVYLEKTGKVLACGNNNYYSGYGITGTRTTNFNIYVPEYVLGTGGLGTQMSEIINIACSDYNTVFLENTGKVLACGFNSTSYGITGTLNTSGTEYIPKYVLGTNGTGQMTGIVSIVCSDYNTVFLENTGKVLACGYNNANGLGITGTLNTSGTEYIPKYVLGTNGTGQMTGIVSIVCSQYNTVFLENTGKVLACGANYSGGITGTLNTSGTEYIPKYVLPPGGIGQMTGIVSIVCSAYHTVYLENTGKVLACGYNNANGINNLGITGTATSGVIVYVPKYVLGIGGTGTQMTGIVSIVCSIYHTVYLENTGRVLACGYNNGDGITGTLTTASAVVYVPQYVLGTGGLGTQMTGIINIVCSRYSTIYLENTGKVLANGSTVFGITGIPTSVGSYIYVPQYVIYTQNLVKNYVKTGKIKNAINGNNCILAITDTDTVIANYDNTYGKLGTVYPGYNYNNFVINYTGTGNLSGVTKIACGLYHTVFLLNTNTVYSCGFNNNGQLGTNNITSSIPTAITNGTSVSNIACGLYHTVLLSGTTAKSCGLNNYGQLGLTDNNNRSTIANITLANVSDIDCGEYFTVLEVGTTVYTTGLNDKGQLGIGNTTNKNIPTQVRAINNTGGTITNVNKIKCTKNNIVFLLSNNTIAVCGNNINNIYDDTAVVYYTYPLLLNFISGTKNIISDIYTNIYTDEIYIKTL